MDANSKCVDDGRHQFNAVIGPKDEKPTMVCVGCGDWFVLDTAGKANGHR